MLCPEKNLECDNSAGQGIAASSMPIGIFVIANTVGFATAVATARLCLECHLAVSEIR